MLFRSILVILNLQAVQHTVLSLEALLVGSVRLGIEGLLVGDSQAAESLYCVLEHDIC